MESLIDDPSVHEPRTPSPCGVADAQTAVPANACLGEDDFDFVFPQAIRWYSSHFWTPVEVAEAAAAFLAPDPSVRVLDVGSGAGKFCIVGAATTGARFSGIEQRPHLVAVAKQASHALRVPRAEFTVGTIEGVNWSSYDAFYFFNPFEENIFQEQGCFDRTVVLSEERFWRDVGFMERVLARAALGTRIATFHGFGGRIPRSYDLVDQKYYDRGILRLWRKTSSDHSFDDGTLEALLPDPEGPSF
jgi:SAM-dependent methyltransferase